MASPSNYAAILAAIKALMVSVSGVGIVHDSQRLTRDWSTFIEQFAKDGHLNGATISRRTTPERWETNLESVRTHTFTIRMLYGVQDEASPHSETTFQLLVEAVCDKFRTDTDFSATCEFHKPLQVRLVDYRMFGGVLCHYAELEVEAQELLQAGG